MIWFLCFNFFVTSITSLFSFRCVTHLYCNKYVGNVNRVPLHIHYLIIKRHMQPLLDEIIFPVYVFS